MAARPEPMGAAKPLPKKTVSSYLGMAFDYEFAAETRASYKGLYTPSPSLRGMSGMLELGWCFKTQADSPLTIDLNASAWAGKQQGYTMGAQFQWNW